MSIRKEDNSMNKPLKVDVLTGNELFNAEWQKVGFQDELKAIEWMIRNHKKIFNINGTGTGGERLTHYEYLDILRGKND